MKKIVQYISLGIVLLSTTSCYEDYKFDYEYTSTYFARQKPLRTLVEEDGKDFSFKFAAALAGKYTQDQTWSVRYELAPDLLEEYPEKSLLPASYYTLSDDHEMIIPAGDLIGEVEVTIDRDLLMNDPKGMTGEYILPLQITSSDMDSIVSGKEYSLIAIKYINEYHGYYYLTGEDIKYDELGAPVDTVVYRKDDDEFVKNIRINGTTQSRYELQVNYVGRFTSKDQYMMLTMDEAGQAVSLSGVEGSLSQVSEGSGSYDPKKRVFTYTYSYVDEEGFAHTATDEVFYSNTVLKLEEWK